VAFALGRGIKIEIQALFHGAGYPIQLGGCGAYFPIAADFDGTPTKPTYQPTTVVKVVSPGSTTLVTRCVGGACVGLGPDLPSRTSAVG
jgi:hypothetical protein